MNPVEVSSEQFRRLAERVAALAADYLEGLDQQRISPATTGEETRRVYSGAVPEEGLGEEAFAALPDLVRLSRAQNGRFFGYVLGSGEPVGAAADLLASVVNPAVTSWRSAPAATTIEKTVVGWLAEALNCAGFTGSLTGGGSSANLMALAMAREAIAPANQDGVQGGV